MKKRLIAVIILILPIYYLSAALFPNYDFTFFKSIEDTLAVLNYERFGFDYSGYGFVGKTMTSGVYIRVGVQMPYSIFFKSENGDNEQDVKDSKAEDLPADSNTIAINNTTKTDESKDTVSGEGKVAKIKDYDYKFALSLGPAFRKFIGEKALWYMGAGITATTEGRSSGSGSIGITSLTIKMSAEFDIGFRIDAIKKNTTLRIGVYGSLDLLTFSSTSTIAQDSSKTEMSLKADIFTPIGGKSPFSATGYISLGHTFKNTKSDIKYIYSNKSRILGAGSCYPITE